MLKHEAEKILQDVPLITGPLSLWQVMEVEDLLKHPGLQHALGLILAERQAFLTQCAHISVGDMAQAQRLGVIQGQVQGIDRLRHVLLECVTVPTDPKDKP